MGASDVKAGGAFIDIYAKDSALASGIAKAEAKMKAFAMGAGASMAMMMAGNPLQAGEKSLENMVGFAAAFGVQMAFAKSTILGMGVAVGLMAVGMIRAADAAERLNDAAEAALNKKIGFGKRDLTVDEQIAVEQEKLNALIESTRHLGIFESGQDVRAKIVEQEGIIWELRKRKAKEAADEQAKADKERLDAAEKLEQAEKQRLIKQISRAVDLEAAGTFDAELLGGMGLGKTLGRQDVANDLQEKTVEQLRLILDELRKNPGAVFER